MNITIVFIIQKFGVSFFMLLNGVSYAHQGQIKGVSESEDRDYILYTYPHTCIQHTIMKKFNFVYYAAETIFHCSAPIRKHWEE